MKEIDFLPIWYKEKKRKQVSYQRQYLALVIVFIAVMLWNYVSTQAISKADAQIIRDASKQTESAIAVLEYNKILNRLQELQGKAKLLDQVDSRIDISAVLAEMSHLTGNKVVLSSLEIKAEKVSGKNKGKNGYIVKPARSRSKSRSIPGGSTKFRIMLHGVAANPKEVGELICRFEQSGYFQQIYPSYSRNTQIRGAGPSGKDLIVTEFELSCYLANYISH